MFLIPFRFVISTALMPTNVPASQPWQQNSTPWGASGATAATPSLSSVASTSSHVMLNPFGNSINTAQQAPSLLNGSQLQNRQPPMIQPQPSLPTPPQQQQAPFAHGRSHSIDSGEMSGLRWQQQASYQLHRTPLANKSLHQTSNGTTSTSLASSPWPTTTPSHSSSLQGPGADPFDVAWAAKSVNKTAGSNVPSSLPPSSSSNTTANPFGANTVKEFEVQL